MMLVLKRIGVGAAFKVGLVLGGMMSAVLGLIAFLFQLTVVNAIMNVATFEVYSPNVSAGEVSQVLSAITTGTLCFLYAMGVIFSSIFSGIGFALVALFYNLTARWVGGLEFETFHAGSGLLDEIEVEMYEKRKRGENF
ncbi:MAG TPA: hypothetical protein VK003_12855 [Oceanobacillus sp.]|nr:hypothetical protein [Oceanobacillus sp.]